MLITICVSNMYVNIYEFNQMYDPNIIGDKPIHFRKSKNLEISLQWEIFDFEISLQPSAHSYSNVVSH